MMTVSKYIHLYIEQYTLESRSKAAVTIYVNDANDHRPVFTFPRPGNDTLVIIISDDAGGAGGDGDGGNNRTRINTREGQPRRVVAYDLDRGVNGVVRYSIVAGNGSHHFRVDKLSLSSIISYVNYSFILISYQYCYYHNY